MAQLEHIRSNGRDSYRVRFTLEGKRCNVALSTFDEPAAIIAKEFIEHLVLQSNRNRLPSKKALEWVETLPEDIHDRLSSFGFVDPRRRSEHPRMLLAFMKTYIDSRTDWKKPENYRQAVSHLETFVKKDVPVGSLTEGDVEQWHRWMTDPKRGPGLSANTAGQNVKRCRHMVAEAIKHRITSENPFAGIKIDLRSDRSKDHEVTARDTLAILEACPDQEWRTIVALNRYGGLRCPSEVLQLRWADISWDHDRLKVRSPKTERYGKGERIVPLFPDLRAELEAQRELIEARGGQSKSDQYVIHRYRDSAIPRPTCGPRLARFVIVPVSLSSPSRS